MILYISNYKFHFWIQNGVCCSYTTDMCRSPLRLISSRDKKPVPAAPLVRRHDGNNELREGEQELFSSQYYRHLGSQLGDTPS